MVQHNSSSSSTQQFHKQVLEVDASQQTVFCVKKVNKRGFFCELENQTKKLGVQIPQNGKQKMFAYNWTIRNQEEKVEITSYWHCPLWLTFGTKTTQSANLMLSFYFCVANYWETLYPRKTSFCMKPWNDVNKQIGRNPTWWQEQRTPPPSMAPSVQ